MKPIEDICKPDPGSTWLSYSKPNPDGSYGESKPLDLEFYYNQANDNSLPDEAPTDVKELWEVSQHLYVYALYEKRFLVASDLYCAMAVELALREICEKDIIEFNRKREAEGLKPYTPGFRWVLKKFKVKVRELLNEDEAEFLFGSLDALVNLRNDFAHPKRNPLYGANMSFLNVASHWLGAYYRGKLKQAVGEWMEVRKKEAERLRELSESKSK